MRAYLGFPKELMTSSECWKRVCSFVIGIAYGAGSGEGEVQKRGRGITEGNGRGEYGYIILYLCMQLSKCKEI